MPTVTILPEPSPSGDTTYRAVAGRLHSVGKSAGATLDALAAQMPAQDSTTLVILQSHEPDRFFTAAQRARLEHLMTAWRSARDRGTEMPAADRAELDALVDTEVQAASARAAALLQELHG